jgi:hypothetical protein
MSITVLALLIFLPTLSYAREDQHGRDAGHSHHGGYHDWNPGLTLVSGMEGIDSRVLVAGDLNPSAEDVVEQMPVYEPSSPVSNPQDDGSYFVVNVPNKTGGYTPVFIQKWGNGYLGPHGELFYPFPGISQLKAMYGI